MKRIKIITLLIMAVISAINLEAQDITDIQTKSLAPISPTAYQFLKFGDIPINEYSGSPSIEIPLLSIDIRGFSLPVKLQYHPKGIHVSEEADWVGLGWDLSFGSVTQITNDKDDLEANMLHNYLPYCYYPSPQLYSSSTAPTYTTPDIDNDITYSYITFVNKPSSTQVWLDQLFNWANINIYDYEQDIFIVNVLGENLYVLIEKQTSSIVCKVLNKKGYNVSLIALANGYYTWKVITPSGITCYYEETNICESSSGSYSGGYDDIFSDQNTNLGNSPSTQGLTSSVFYNRSRIWQISKISSVYGDTIHFNYSTTKKLTSYNISQHWQVANQIGYTNFSYMSNAQTYGPTSTPPNYLVNAYQNGKMLDRVVLSPVYYYQERSYLKSITYNSSSILFITSPRNDWANSLELDSIAVNNSLQQNVKNIKFNYYYSQSSYTGKGFNNIEKDVNEMTKRLILSSLTTNKDEKYNFTYNATPLPPKNSYAVDFWGYYNGQTNNRSLLANVNDFDATLVNTYGSALLKNTPKRFADNDYCKAGILEKIQYPTGGYSKFQYSLNSFSNYVVPNNPQNSASGLYYGNGLKTDSIINYLNDGSIVSTNQFKYIGGKLQIPLRPYYSMSESYHYIGGGLHYIYDANILNICSSSCYIPNPFGDGSGVGYDNVLSTKIDSKTNKCNGYTKHYYINNPDMVAASAYLTITGNSLPSYHKGLNNGILLQEDVFDVNNIKLNSTKFQYNISYNVLSYNAKTAFLGLWCYEKASSDGQPVAIIDEKRMRVLYYPLYKPEALLQNKRRVDYFNADSVVTTELYNYNSYNIQNSKSVANSNTSQAKNDSYLFPYDIYNNSNYSQTQQNIMQSLISQNRLDEKIQINSSIYTKGAGTSKTQLMLYDATTLLPDTLQISLGNNSLQTEMIFNYDAQKNIVEKIGRDNISTSYIWGYNSQYPIAEIKNAKYNDIKTSLGIDPKALAESATPDMSKVDGLRSTLTNAQVTTYTYKPLIGITSVTTPLGITTNYNYDEFGRLINIKNTDNQVINTYDYHYKQ